MKKGGGRAKGSAFERHVAKMVVATFECYGISNADCYRTPLSGGHLHASKLDPGDLVMSPKLRKYFPYSVECKSYKKLDWPKLLSPGKDKGHWTDWWQQCKKASGEALPLLVFRQNRSEIFVLFRANDGFDKMWECWSRIQAALKPFLRTTLDGDVVKVVRFERFLGCRLHYYNGNEKGLKA